MKVRITYSDRAWFQIGDDGEDLGMIAHAFPNPKVNDELGTHIAKCVNEYPKLLATLRKCETAIESLPVDALGFGTTDTSRWPLRDELLGEIREVLG